MWQREVVEGQGHWLLPANSVARGTVPLLSFATRFVVRVPEVSYRAVEQVAPVATPSVEADLIFAMADVAPLTLVDIHARSLVVVQLVAFRTRTGVRSRFVDARPDAKASAAFPHLALVHVDACMGIIGEAESLAADALVRAPRVDA